MAANQAILELTGDRLKADGAEGGFEEIGPELDVVFRAATVFDLPDY